MNEKSTYELDKILSSVEPEHFNRYRNEEDTDSQMSVSEFFNWYIGCHGLQLSDVIRQSDIPANYAYGILNGNRANPSRDRVIDSHIHICRCINGFGNSGEMQAIGGGYASYADGTIFQMIPECLGEYDVTPEAVLKVMDEAGVSKAVMLQGNFLGPQNLYTYEAAKKYPDRLAAAATYDPFCRNVDSIRKHLFEDLGIKIVKFEVSTGSGLMSYHHTIPLDGDVIEEMLSYAEMHNNTVVFDIGRYPAECWQPEALARAIKRHPDTQFVVCHLLAPRGLVQENVWLKGMEALTLDNVVFDLASLPSNQGKDARYPYPDAIHYIKRAIELVGSDRLMWGSDLPMNLCKDSYRHLIDYIVLSNEISTPDKENIMAATAAKVYFK